jgi:DNA repair protein RecO (recombination protein O)
LSPPVKTDAIVIRSRAYGEADKIVTFLTREHGKLAGIAKGAAKSRRRFVGSLEPATEIRLAFRSRAQSDLCFVEAAEIVRSRRRLTRDLDRYAYTTYVLEVLDCMVEGKEAEPAVYELARKLLTEIDEREGAPPGAEVLRYFEIQLLTLCGLEPRLAVCRRCGRPAAELATARFDPLSGGLACERCETGGGIPLSRESLAALRDLRAAPIEGVLPLAGTVAGEVRVLLQTFLQHHVRRPLKSPALLREILGI